MPTGSPAPALVPRGGSEVTFGGYSRAGLFGSAPATGSGAPSWTPLVPFSAGCQRCSIWATASLEGKAAPLGAGGATGPAGGVPAGGVNGGPCGTTGGAVGKAPGGGAGAG